MTAASLHAPVGGRGATPILGDERSRGEGVLVYVFVIVPLLAVLAAVPLAWGWGQGRPPDAHRPRDSRQLGAAG